MRKTIIGFIFGFVLALSVSAYAGTVIKSAVYNDTKVKLDGTPLTLSAQFATIVNDGQSNGSNFAPIRALCEAMGYSVDWDRQTNTILLKSPMTDLETVAAKCKDSCVMITADLPGNKRSQGSGWVYNGYVITARHVVEGGTNIAVFMDGSKTGVWGTIHYIDKTYDLAVIKANTGMPSVTLGDSSKLREGEKLVSISCPFSALNVLEECTYSGLSNHGTHLFIADTTMDNGSSGGAIFNYDGEVVGMAESSNGSKALINAIPINSIKPILESLK